MSDEARFAGVALCTEGLTSSRERARQLIEAGLAFCDGAMIDKPSRKIAPGAKLEVRGEVCPYVSLSGFKPKKALRVFGAVPSFHNVAALRVLHPSPTNSTGGEICQRPKNPAART